MSQSALEGTCVSIQNPGQLPVVFHVLLFDSNLHRRTENGDAVALLAEVLVSMAGLLCPLALAPWLTWDRFLPSSQGLLLAGR